MHSVKNIQPKFHLWSNEAKWTERSVHEKSGTEIDRVFALFRLSNFNEAKEVSVLIQLPSFPNRGVFY